MNFARLFRTVRHLRWSQLRGQLWWRVRSRFERPKRFFDEARAPELTLSDPPVEARLAPPTPLDDAVGIRSGRFCFLNQRCELGFPPVWTPRTESRLWGYNLHYFDWMWALLPEDAVEEDWQRAVQAVDDWMLRHPLDRGATGWEPYPISLRTINWMLLLYVRHRDRTCAAAEFDGRLRASLWCQLEWLDRHLETHIQANHLLENVAALAVAGSVFAGAEGARWRKRALGLLPGELGEQILSDGCHYERSPMYHVRMLWLMEILNRVGTREFREVVEPVLDPMRRALRHMRHPDGTLALLNDAATGIYAMAEDDGPAPQGAWALAAAGYHGWSDAAGNYLIVDVAPIGPDHQPGHAHADYLSFELSLGGRRVITDTGVLNYENGPERWRDRSTAAHNTVEIEGGNSCEVWSAFRVGRRVRPELIEWSPKETGMSLSARHAGYSHLRGGPIHERRMEWRAGHLSVVDRVRSRCPVAAIGRLHLAPGFSVRVDGTQAVCRQSGLEVEIRFEGNGELRLSSGQYHPEFGISLERPVLEYRVTAVRETEWSTTIRRTSA